MLVRQKEKILPLTLRSLCELDYPKNRISLYVRTNNNTDATQVILEEWLAENTADYLSVVYSSTDAQEKIENCEGWNVEKFHVLAGVRQDALNHAMKISADFFFTMNVDNVVIPSTLSELVSLNLPIVAPLLRECTTKIYSNYFCKCCATGYYLDHPNYLKILNREVKGVIDVPLIRSTYLIRGDVIKHLTFQDSSDRYPYAILADSARNANIPQYIDNRKEWGFLSLDDNASQLQAKMYPDFSSIFSNVAQEYSSTTDKKYREFLQKFMKDENVKTVIDFGCGKWTYQNEIDWKDIDYIGVCFTEEEIQGKHGNVKFVRGSDLHSVDKADLIICKDVFQHLPIEHNKKLLDQFKEKSRISLIVNDNSIHQDCNKDIQIGEWSPIKLDYKPYSENAFDVLNYSVPGKCLKTVYVIYNV